jgi:predicted polyphosphate/ATP-dependent NAD kinase
VFSVAKRSLRIGFLINPIAGMGGRVGLKGTDNVSKDAADLGAKPISPLRAKEFLERLKALDLAAEIKWITCPGIMGEHEISEADLDARVLPMQTKNETSANDTKLAVKLMAEVKVRLIAFVGGDGTARDILNASKDLAIIPVLGVPSGVKMYSGVFAASPTDAADLLADFLEGSTQLIDSEVMDADEEAIRRDSLNVSLYGFLKSPFVPMQLLLSKGISPETVDEHENQMAIARFIVEEMRDEATYILGPGTTIKCIADLLEVEKTLLGVDMYRNKRVVRDVNESKILNEIRDWDNTWIVVSPIGRQGMLLGRGNQQISPEIIKRVGKKHIVVAATKTKLQGIQGGLLRVDTGDPEVDQMLKGYMKVATDYREWRLIEIV